MEEPSRLFSDPSGPFRYTKGGKWKRYTEGGQLTDTVRPTTM